MKLATQTVDTRVSGNVQAPRTFCIANTAGAFMTLSSGLYNDKIRAIIRELCCNAWDAHVMAGKRGVSFEVHLPTDIEPTFRIKDWGVGLSHEDVMVLYCTYFQSAKTSSNETVGALGLGSKSPFCYTQSRGETQGFMVTSRFEGMKRIYSAYVHDGAPTIVCLSEEKTAEPNGLEVAFAVNTEDVWEFENKAKMALEFFDPVPQVNLEGFEPVRQDYVIRTDKWALRKVAEGSNSDGKGVRAIQGMVQYQVGSIDISRMSREQQLVAALPLDLFFPIGELSVAASREALSNDQRTIANILAMYTKVYDGLFEEVRKTLNECKHAWQARIQLWRVLASPMGAILQEAYDAGKFDGVYANFKLSKDRPTLYEMDYKVMQVTKFRHTDTKSAKRVTLFQKRTRDERQATFAEIAKTPLVKPNFLREFEVEDGVTFILNDLGQRSGSKYVQAYVQHEACTVAYVFSTMEGQHQDKAMRKEFAKAMVTLGEPPYILLSSVTVKLQPYVDALKVPRAARALGTLELTGDGSHYRRRKGWVNSWQRTPDTDLPKGMKFFVPVKNKEVITAGRKCSFSRANEFISLVNNIRQSKVFPQINPATRVFGLTPTAVEKATSGKKTEWVNFFDFVFGNAQDAITDARVLELSILTHPFACHHEPILKAILDDEAEYAGSPLLDFARSYTAAKKVDVKAQATAELVKILSYWGVYKAAAALKFSDAWADIVRKYYPMLGLVYNPYDSGGALSSGLYRQSVLEYIKLMDNQRKAEAI